MELDLTRLNSLAFIDLVGNAEAHRKPSEPQKNRAEYKIIAEQKNTVERSTDGLAGVTALQLEADRKKQAIDQSLAICREYQQNIKTSSQLQTEILKGARAGEDIYILFLKAAKAISLMTSNKQFYSQLEGDIGAIYAVGLREEAALNREIEKVTERYIRLLDTLNREPEGDSKDRIRQSIKAHENRIIELVELRDGAS